MVAENQDTLHTAFTITVDLAQGTTTGISAADRSATLMALANPDYVARDFNRPGHVFPLRAADGGLSKRLGHTEAAVELARLAGLNPAGALAEIVSSDGSMARRNELAQFCAMHGLPLITIRDLAAYRQSSEPAAECAL